MATILRQRVAEAGAHIDLLVLASEPTGSIGVDLASGAFVRARHPVNGSRMLRPYSVARGEDGSTLASREQFLPGMRFDLVLRDGVVPSEARRKES